jgi:predicted nucleotidyltransferase
MWLPFSGSGKRSPHMPEPTFEELIDAMKAAAGILQEREIEFVLSGGLAAWARGGPKSEHDVDIFVRPRDAEAAYAAFEDAGMRVERPPEGWLYKAWHDNGTLIDVIFSPAGGEVTDEMVERAPVLEVMALRIRVSTLEDVLVTKLLALNEQEPSFGSVLELARALREQIDWDEVRARTEASPFARAFFTLVEELGVVDRSAV